MDAKQLALLESDYDSDVWDPDDWETPDWLARKIADFVLPTDKFILEPAAGTGQIAKYLPRRLYCIEKNTNRMMTGMRRHGLSYTLCRDFLKCSLPRQTFHLVVTNPPFSIAVDFIEMGLEMLDKRYEHARLLYLLPIDFFSSAARNQGFQRLNASISNIYPIVKRVGYLKEGVAFYERQVYDALFEIRHGKNKGIRFITR